MMNGMITDFIRGMRMIRIRSSQLKSCKTLPILLSESTYLHVRWTSTNLIVNIAGTKPGVELNDLEQNLIKNPEQVEKFVKDWLIRGGNIGSLVKKLNSFGDVHSRDLLILKNISELKDVTPEKRMKLAEDVLNALRSLKVTITEDHYVGLMTCYSNSKSFPKIDDLLSGMKNDGIQPSKTLQETISKCLSQMRKPKELLEFIRKLNEAGIEINESLYAEQICCYAASGNLNRALEEYHILLKKDNCDARNLKLSLLKGLIFHGEESLFRDELAVFTNGFTVSDNELYCIFQSILESENLHLVPHVVFVIDKAFLVEMFLRILSKLIHEMGIDKTINLLESLYSVRKSSSVPHLEFPTSLFKAFIDELDAIHHPFPDILEKCKELRKIEECHYALEYLLFKYLEKKDMVKSVEVINGLFQCDANIEQSYFWPLFIQAHKQFNVEGVCHIVQVMFSVGIYPESETLLKYVYPYLDMKECFKYFKILSFSGRFFQFLTEVFVIYALENDCLNECVALLKKRPLDSYATYYFLKEPFMKAVTTKEISPPLFTILKNFNPVDPFIVIDVLWSTGDEDRMRKFVKGLLEAKISGTNTNVAESLLKKPKLPQDIKEDIRMLMKLKPKTRISKHSGMELEKEFSRLSLSHFTLFFRINTRVLSVFAPDVSPPSLAGGIFSGTDRKLKNAEQTLFECLEIIRKGEIHVSELMYKRMNFIGQYFRILKYSMKIGLYHKAVNIRNKMLKILGPDHDLSPSFIACLCRLYEFEGNYEEALRYYHTVREKYPTFYLDVPKVAGLSILFIQLGKIDELMDMLERMPIWWGNLSSIEHKMTKLLKGVASLGDPELTRTVFDLLLRKQVIAVTGNTLQPFVETYIKMGDIEKATKEMKKMIAIHKIVPTPSGILWELICRRDFDRMEEILYITTDFFGTDDVTLSTMRMIACLGDVQILNNYLEKYNISELDKRFPYVLGWEHFGGEIEIRMKALETFMFTSKRVEAKYLFADFAVEHVCCERDANAANKLYDFLEEQKLLYRFVDKLNNIIELGKTLNNIVGPLRNQPKFNIWREHLD